VTSRIDLKRLFDAIRAGYALDWDGIHGASHWARVRENGLRLAERTGARADVVELFAFLHDSRRVNDAIDHAHGARGAALARTLRGDAFDLDDAGMDLLLEACTAHTDGIVTEDPTVGTCWDADRLDLPRVWITPRPRLLCTAAARDPHFREWARKRAQAEPG
jgi:uncharacterized protein